MKRVILLFFTILVASMCKADDFTYTTSGNSATITKYNGSEKSVVFPTEITKDDITYHVTSIIGITSVIPSDNTKVEEIFIPSAIANIQKLTRDSKSIKTIVIENGKANIDHLFIYSSMPMAIAPLNNIIFLSSCEYLSNQLINVDPHYLLKTGEITISYKSDEKNEKKEAVQMYLFDKGWSSARPFGEERFKYLLSALQNSGKDISKISTIDLSGMSTNPTNIGVNFTFDADDYNPSSELSPGAIVITDNNSYTASGTRTTTIIDKENFTAPQYSILTEITYNRSNTLNWNSVCLPFDIKESDFGTSCKIYTVTSASTADNRISLTRVENSETVVEAGTPCFIYSTADHWDLNLHNVTISNNVAPKTINVDNYWQVVGSFTNKTIGTGKYKLNSSGTEFGITNNEAATVTAFRCYLNYIGPQGAPNRLSVNIDEEASITLVPNDAEPQKVKLYDLMGRPRKEGSQGIFIKSKR